MTVFIRLLVFMKTLKNRFSQLIINKKTFLQIKRIQKDSYKK